MTKKKMMNMKMTNEILEAGWIKKPLGYYISSGTVKTYEDFTLLVRETKEKAKGFGNFREKFPSPKTEKPHNHAVFGNGVNAPVGSPKDSVTPGHAGLSSLPSCNHNFEELPSLSALRTNTPNLIIGFDSEWVTMESGLRSMLSWQFAVEANNVLYEFVFFKDGDNNLDFNFAVGVILDYLGLYEPIDLRKVLRFTYCDSWDAEGKPHVVTTDSVSEARNNCRFVYRDGFFTGELINDMPDRFVKRDDRDWSWFHRFYDFSEVKKEPVSILCHFGLVDLTSLSGIDYYLRHASEVGGGIVTLEPFRFTPRSLTVSSARHTAVYPVTMSFSDTMCHSAPNKKKLADLAKTVGLEKIRLGSSDTEEELIKNNMDKFLLDHPAEFLEYASNDSVITLRYAQKMYGINQRIPVTITSATAGVMKGVMMDYMKCSNVPDFNTNYRGLKKVSHGLAPSEDRASFIESSSLEPLNPDAQSVQNFASQAYHGGYNSCSEVGFFNFPTFDYDLKNAYPTAMCLVPDIDWNNPILNEINGGNTGIPLDLGFWRTPAGYNAMLPMVAYVSFKFPEAVKYPCIPVNVDGIPVYPRSSEGIHGVYVAGPFIYLALRLGAEVRCHRGYFLRTLSNEDGTESRALSRAVFQMVTDRARAKAWFGKGGFEEQLIKVMVNSGYGKVAQNVIDKSKWSAYTQAMESLGCSSITNPVSAMLITSFVQCELLACQNQLVSAGFGSYSVTTDGMISDCPIDVLRNLDLYGFGILAAQSRLFLTNAEDPTIWEAKHAQDDLINFTTRGNVSLYSKETPFLYNCISYAGVCAHNSAKSGFPSDSYEDRLWLMTQVLGRTGTISSTQQVFPSLKDIVYYKKPFMVQAKTRKLHMDFDLKRKPVLETMRTDYPVVNGTRYELAHFDTEPYQTISEFKKFREKKKLTDCLRTKREWETFFAKFDVNRRGIQLTDLDRSIIMSIVMGYRAGLWKIEAMDSMNVEEKVAFINKHNDAKKPFTANDWKNCRRPERQANILPQEYLQEKLEEMQNDI